MILGFKPRFVAPIFQGTKIHTIRLDRMGRWHAGRAIQFATGVRTKQYNQFRRGDCVSVEYIRIRWDGPNPFVFIGPSMEKLLPVTKDIEDVVLPALAANDGFSCVGEFFEWFNEDFDGKIIHWTDFRYVVADRIV